jgi:hypothetical protein
MRRCLLLLTRLVLTHQPSYIATYLLTSSRPTETVSSSTYKAGTCSLTILPTYLLTHFNASHPDVVYFYSRGWCLLTNHPTYLLTPSRPNETTATSTYEAAHYSLICLPAYLPTYCIRSQRGIVYFYLRGWYLLTNLPIPTYLFTHSIMSRHNVRSTWKVSAPTYEADIYSRGWYLLTNHHT